MACRLDNDLAHALVFIEIVLGKTQVFAIQEVFQGPTVSAKMTRVDEKIRFTLFGLVENHRFGHVFLSLSGPYNALSFRGF